MMNFLIHSMDERKENIDSKDQQGQSAYILCQNHFYFNSVVGREFLELGGTELLLKAVSLINLYAVQNTV